MKRWMLLLPLLLLLLTGCDRRQQVGICWRDCDDPLTADYRQSLELLFDQNVYALTVMDAGNDQAVQDRQVGELISKKTDVLIVECVMTTALDEVLRQAQEAGVPVVFVNREPAAAALESWDKFCYVGCDASQPGLLQAQLLYGLSNGGDLNGDGTMTYAMIAGPADHLDAQLRTEGCMAGLPEGECLGVEHTDWSREDARRCCAMLLAKYGKDLEAIFCNSDELAFGAMEAIRDGGRTVGENLYLYGIDGQRQALLLIRSADLTGTVSVDLPTQAESVLIAVQTLLADGVPEKRVYIDHIPVSAENVEDYLEN